MSTSQMTNEEKKKLSNLRQAAVRQAWRAEKERVQNGLGTRDWSPAEQKEILERGAVKGYEGHHMKSVSQFPEYAGDSKNIQFLSEEEHLLGAHQGSYHNSTNGYFDPETKKMQEFRAGELPALKEKHLKERYEGPEKAGKDEIKEKYKADNIGEKETSEKLASARDAYKKEADSNNKEPLNNNTTNEKKNGGVSGEAESDEMRR